LRKSEIENRAKALEIAEDILFKSGGDPNKLTDRERIQVDNAVQALKEYRDSGKMNPKDLDSVQAKIDQLTELLRKTGTPQDIGPRAVKAFQSLKIQDYIDAVMAKYPDLKTVDDILSKQLEIQNLVGQVDRRLLMDNQAAFSKMLNDPKNKAIIEEFLKKPRPALRTPEKKTSISPNGFDLGETVGVNKGEDIQGAVNRSYLLRQQGLNNIDMGELLTEQQNARRAAGSVNIAPVSVDNRKISGNTTNQSINVSQGSPSTIDQYGLGTPGLSYL